MLNPSSLGGGGGGGDTNRRQPCYVQGGDVARWGCCFLMGSNTAESNTDPETVGLGGFSALATSAPWELTSHGEVIISHSNSIIY